MSLIPMKSLVAVFLDANTAAKTGGIGELMIERVIGWDEEAQVFMILEPNEATLDNVREYTTPLFDMKARMQRNARQEVAYPPVDTILIGVYSDDDKYRYTELAREIAADLQGMWQDALQEAKDA